MLHIIFSNCEYNLPLYSITSIREEVIKIENLIGESCLYYEVRSIV